MKTLETVDLVVMDGVDGTRLQTALRRTLRDLRFRRVLVFAPAIGFTGFAFPEGQKVEHFAFRSDYEGWNRFMVKELWKYLPVTKGALRGGHCLFIHHDGYVLNGDAWEDNFLRYDYIGAPWWYEDDNNVGNGGFSLRSKFFLDCSNEFEWACYAPEDHKLVRENGALLRERGVWFAPEAVAKRFALEGNAKQGGLWNGQFGFHNPGMTDIRLYQE